MHSELFATINLYYREQLEVCFSNVSVTQMFTIQIPTVPHMLHLHGPILSDSQMVQLANGIQKPNTGVLYSDHHLNIEENLNCRIVQFWYESSIRGFRFRTPNRGALTTDYCGFENLDKSLYTDCWLFKP